MDATKSTSSAFYIFIENLNYFWFVFLRCCFFFFIGWSFSDSIIKILNKCVWLQRSTIFFRILLNAFPIKNLCSRLTFVFLFSNRWMTCILLQFMNVNMGYDCEWLNKYWHKHQIFLLSIVKNLESLFTEKSLPHSKQIWIFLRIVRKIVHYLPENYMHFY